MRRNEGNILVKKFMDNISSEYPGDCWNWNAAKNRKGYGQIRVCGRLRIAHRIGYELAYGSFNYDLQVLHKCDNPSCVNPQHLFLGTNLDNVKDKVSKGRQAHKNKTHCPQGHPYFGNNLYIKPTGFRVCRECQRTNWRNRYRARKGVVGECAKSSNRI